MATFLTANLGAIDRDASQLYAIKKAARQLSVSYGALAAVVHVESGGRSFAMVNGRPEPLIRFEGHYFHRLLSTSLRSQAVQSGLASSRAGDIRNPRTQANRWRLLRRARDIDRSAADQSVSWGIGQVMGANWKMLGYSSVAALVADARSGFDGQLRLMTRFIVQRDLLPHLRAADFAAFARVYNGPAYAKHGYHTRMEAAFRRFSGTYLPSHQRDWLGLGDFGPQVQELQKELRAAGEMIAIDGDFGPDTHRAVVRFQARSKLPVDGMAGPATRAALLAYLPVPQTQPNGLQLFRRFTQNLGRALQSS
ncbi:MAG: N-acetylmuramidase domain-containing protein [Pseudomonadota bacterium]